MTILRKYEIIKISNRKRCMFVQYAQHECVAKINIAICRFPKCNTQVICSPPPFSIVYLLSSHATRYNLDVWMDGVFLGAWSIDKKPPLIADTFSKRLFKNLIFDFFRVSK